MVSDAKSHHRTRQNQPVDATAAQQRHPLGALAPMRWISTTHSSPAIGWAQGIGSTRLAPAEGESGWHRRETHAPPATPTRNNASSLCHMRLCLRIGAPGGLRQCAARHLHVDDQKRSGRQPLGGDADKILVFVTATCANSPSRLASVSARTSSAVIQPCRRAGSGPVDLTHRRQRWWYSPDPRPCIAFQRPFAAPPAVIRPVMPCAVR